MESRNARLFTTWPEWYVPMKYSLRSLMIAATIAPPLLALVVIIAPLILERLCPPTPVPPSAGSLPVDFVYNGAFLDSEVIESDAPVTIPPKP